MSLRKYRLSVGVENVHSVIPGMQMEKLYGRVRRSCLAPMKAMWRFAGSTTKKENYGKKLEQKMKRAPGGTVKLSKSSKISEKGDSSMSKKKAAFICVHNSCRSQIAEAFGKHLASDIFESYSAGTETKPQINQDAVRIMKTSYGIDMEADGQYSKLIRDIPTPDIVISMGCNVGCPFIDRPFDDNWGLEDPTGKNDEAFKLVIEEIRKKILELKKNAS